MTGQVAARKISTARRAVLAAAGLVLLVAAALLSFGPSVSAAKRPTAADIALARNLVEDVKAAQAAGEPVRLDLGNRELRALSALASDTAGKRKVWAEVREGEFTALASFPLVAGLWFNSSATIVGEHAGFPEFRLKLGRVPLPPTASRWVADLAHGWLAGRGVTLPDFDQTVRQLIVREDRVEAVLALPHSTGLVGRLVSAAGAPVDARAVAAIYCDLTKTLGDAPEPQLAPLVRRAFREAGEADPVDRNRAALVALALLVVGEKAEPLAPAIATVRARCPAPATPVLLRDRPDLAQHWALSAALTAVLGEETAANLGEWKELHDSLPAGSGFSFVDLAADRSGIHVARRAVAPTTAAATAQTLRRATEAELLPDTLLEAPEGLSDVDFGARFGGIETEAYRRAVAWIDRQLGLPSTGSR